MEKGNGDTSSRSDRTSKLITQQMILLDGNISSKLKPESPPKSYFFFRSTTEFVSGYIAACASITVLYPLNKLIFRQILGGLSSRVAIAQIQKEGFNNLYRGLLPPLLQKSTSYSIMFGSQHEYYLWLRALTDTSQNELIRGLSEPQRHFMATSASAAMAGLTEASLTPLERIQAIMQMQEYHTRFRHTWHAFREIGMQYGPFELYRGLSAICLRNSLSNVMFFTSRTRLKSLFPPAKNNLHNAVYDFLSGGLLGAFISTVFYPLNVVKSHMQARIGGKYYGTVETLKMTFELKNRNVKLFYKGVGSNFLRAVLAWGITNAVYEAALKSLKKT
jgi:hypothetical protein